MELVTLDTMFIVFSLSMLNCLSFAFGREIHCTCICVLQLMLLAKVVRVPLKKKTIIGIRPKTIMGVHA